MSKTNYERNRVLNNRYGDGAGYVKPATVYLALYTAMPTVSTGGTEVTGGSYARQAITNDNANFPDPTVGITQNGLQIDFPAASAPWGTIVGAAICDASTAGNIQDFAPLSASKVVGIGDVISFPAGSLVFTET